MNGSDMSDMIGNLYFNSLRLDIGHCHLPKPIFLDHEQGLRMAYDTHTASNRHFMPSLHSHSHTVVAHSSDAILYNDESMTTYDWKVCVSVPVLVCC